MFGHEDFVQLEGKAMCGACANRSGTRQTGWCLYFIGEGKDRAGRDLVQKCTYCMWSKGSCRGATLPEEEKEESEVEEVPKRVAHPRIRAQGAGKPSIVEADGFLEAARVIAKEVGKDVGELFIGFVSVVRKD